MGDSQYLDRCGLGRENHSSLTPKTPKKLETEKMETETKLKLCCCMPILAIRPLTISLQKPPEESVLQHHRQTDRQTNKQTG